MVKRSDQPHQHKRTRAASTTQPERPLRWVGNSKKALTSMPAEVQDVFGFGLHELECGEVPNGARPFGEGLDARIHKLRCDAADKNTYRLAYVAVFPEVVYVLDVFEKKSKTGKATPKPIKDRVEDAFDAALAHYKISFGLKR